MEALALISAPLRREILRLVWESERTAGEIARHFSVTFGAVSQHLAKLRAGGVVTRRRQGRRQYYKANREALGPAAAMLEAMWREQLGELKRLAEAEEGGR